MTGRLLLAVTLPLRWILYWLSGLVVRRHSLVVFGAPKDEFTDNSKYLFLDAVSSGIDATWISGDAAVVEGVRKLGLRAEYRWSLAGLRATMRAGTFVVSCYVSDVNFWTSRGAQVLNLWHGVPLKKIERSVDRGPIARRFDHRWWVRLPYAVAAPHVYRRPDRLLVPAPSFAGIFATAFDVPTDSLIVAGYPRNALIAADARDSVLSRPSTEDCLALFGVPAIASSELRVLYAPTWRENDRNFISSCPINWQALDESLAQLSIRMTVRLHPAATCSRWPEGLQRITLQQGGSDVYGLMSIYDCLITDYSSIYFDYLLLDRPILFFPYDLARYRSDTRGFYFDYEDMTPGPIAVNQKQLVGLLRRVGDDPWAVDRRLLVKRLGLRDDILRAADCLPARSHR